MFIPLPPLFFLIPELHIHSFPKLLLKTHNIHLRAMKNPIIVNSPRGIILASYCCLPISLILRRVGGVEFKVTPIVLRTAGIDLILGMDWMMQQKAMIQCKEKAVELTSPTGDRIKVEVVVQKQQTATVNQLDDEANNQDLVEDEFPNVFPDDLPGMPPDRDIEFIIELLPGTAPIGKRLYRMGVDKLEKLKKQIKELQDKVSFVLVLYLGEHQ
jgi:hypothetical protein